MTNGDQPVPVVLPERVAILFSEVKREYFPSQEAYLTEKDADIYAQEVAKYVGKMGIKVALYPGNEAVVNKLRYFKPDLVVNLVDSVRGDETLNASVPGMLEMLHLPYTGSGILGMSLNTNKYLTYQLLQNGGIPVPHHQLVTQPNQLIDPVLRYPLFAKLNNMHSSIAIDDNSICQNERELRLKLKEMYEQYHQPMLVDEFIAGKEVTVPVLDGLNTKVYPAERMFTNGETEKPEGYKIVTFKQKWVTWEGTTFIKHEDDNLKELARKAFSLVKMSDYSRFDVRVDGAGRNYFIDANANPFFGPPQETQSPYTMILEMYGVNFEEILRRLFVNTMRSVSGLRVPKGERRDRPAEPPKTPLNVTAPKKKFWRILG